MNLLQNKPEILAFTSPSSLKHQNFKFNVYDVFNKFLYKYIVLFSRLYFVLHDFIDVLKINIKEFFGGDDTETYIPSIEELTVPEIKLTSGPLMAAALHLGKYCDEKCKEFMICYQETFHNPVECLKEGKEVTECGIEFLRKVKNNCSCEFADYHFCLDKRAGMNNDIYECRETQYLFDQCMDTKVGISRPEPGYFSKTRLHKTDRPRYQVNLAPMPEEIPDAPDYKNMPPPPGLAILNRAFINFAGQK